MGKQRPLFGGSEDLFQKSPTDVAIDQGDVLTQTWAKQALAKPAFDPYTQTKHLNPATGQKDVVKQYDPKSVMVNGGFDYSKVPVDIVKSRAAYDELTGKAAPGFSERIKDDHNILTGYQNKAAKTLAEMNAVARLDPMTADPTTEGAPSAYHQRYDWTVNKLKSMGVVDKSSYDVAKGKLQKEGGTDWYNLQQLIGNQLRGADKKPVNVKEDDLIGALSAQNTMNNYAKPYALQMLGLKAEPQQTQPKQATSEQQAQTPKEAKSTAFSNGKKSYEDQFEEWRAKTSINADVTPDALKKKGSTTSVLSKKAVEQELNWLEGALIEKKLNHAIDHDYGGSSDDISYRSNLQAHLQTQKDKIAGKQRPRFGDWRDTFMDVNDGITRAADHANDVAAAVGEFLASPIESFKRNDKEMDELQQHIDHRKELLKTFEATQNYEAERAKTHKTAGVPITAPNPYPVNVSPDDPDHFVVDKKALSERNLGETTLDATKALGDYAYNRKFTALGGVLGSLAGGWGAIPGAALGNTMDAAFSNNDSFSAGNKYLGGQNINETATRDALGDILAPNAKEGLRENKATTDFWGVEDPTETLLSSGITSTGTLLVDLMAAGKATEGVMGMAEKLAPVLSKGLVAASTNKELPTLLSKAATLMVRAGEIAGKPLAAIADTQAGKNVIPILNNMVEGGVEGAIQFGIAEMLKSNPALSPQDIIQASKEGAIYGAAERLVTDLFLGAAKKAGKFVAKQKLDGYQGSTISKDIRDQIENVAKLQSIEKEGLEGFANTMKAGWAINKASQTMGGGVSEIVQSLADNYEKGGNIWHDYNGTAMLGDFAGGMLFGAMGVARGKRAKLDARGNPVIDKGGRSVMETAPFKTVQEVKEALDQKAVNLYKEETAQKIYNGVQQQLTNDAATITKMGAEPVASPQSQQETAASTNTNQAEQHVSSAQALDPQQETVAHLIAQAGGSTQTQYSSQSTPEMGKQPTMVEQVKADYDAGVQREQGKANPLKNVPTPSQETAPHVDAAIADAIEQVQQTVEHVKAQGEDVTEEKVRGWSDDAAATIAFLKSKGVNLAVLPSINVEGDIKYGAFVQSKDKEALASVIALNVPDTLKKASNKVGDSSGLQQKAFHEFNHRLRYAIDNNLIEDYSPIPNEKLKELKDNETRSLQTLTEQSPYIGQWYKAQKDAGLDDAQALEEVSSMVFENMYANGGNATGLLRHIAAIDKQKAQQATQQATEPTEGEAAQAPVEAPNASKMTTLMGALPKSLSALITPLKEYFEGAKAAATIAPDIVEQAQVFQQYYDAAVRTVTQKEVGAAQEALEQQVRQQFAQVTAPKPTGADYDVHNDLQTVYSSAAFDDLQGNLNYAMDLGNMSDMRKIPSFLKDYFGLTSTKEVYDAFAQRGGMFEHAQTFADAMVEKRGEQFAKAGKEFTHKEQDAAKKFAIKTWTKFQGYEPAKMANVVVKQTMTNGKPLLQYIVDHNPTRIGGANIKSKINKPTQAYQIKRSNYGNFIQDLTLLGQSLVHNGLDNPLDTSSLIQALRKATPYTVGSLTLEMIAGEGANVDVDTATGRYNALEESKWDPAVYEAVPTAATDLLAQGWFVWNHAQQGSTALLDMREHLADMKHVERGIAGMNKMFINYYISNYGQPFTYNKTKAQIGVKEVNLLNYLNYTGDNDSNAVLTIVDAGRIATDFNPDSSEYKQATAQAAMLALTVQEHVNNEVLKGYAYFPTAKELTEHPDFRREYAIGKTQSVIDSLMHIQIDPSFDRIKVIDKLDSKTGTMKMMKANEKYMRGVVGANSVPLSREQFLNLPFVADHVKDGKLDMYGLEDDGGVIHARGFVLNTKKAKETLAAFPTLQKIFADTVIDGGVINVNDDTQDLLTLLGGQEGKSNKTHSHNRTANGVVNFKQAVHRYSQDAVEKQLAAQHPAYQELEQFMQLMKAANIQYVIPDSALKARAQYISTKNVQPTSLYGKQVVMGSKGNIIGEWNGEEIKPLDDFTLTDGYPVLSLDSEPFTSPHHPSVQAITQGHGLVKIPITGSKGLQWMDSINPPNKNDQKSGGFPAQLFFKGHHLLSPTGIGGLNVSEPLQQRLDEAGYGNDNAYNILTDRIQRHGETRDRLWEGYNNILQMLKGENVDQSASVFMLEQLKDSIKEKMDDMTTTSTSGDVTDFNLLNAALKQNSDGSKGINVQMLGPLFLLSDSLLENDAGKFTDIPMYVKEGQNTKFFTMLAEIHDDVAKVKGKGALPVLVPDIARGMADSYRAKDMLTKAIGGNAVEIHGEMVQMDVVDDLKDEEGNIDWKKTDKFFEKHIDLKTGMFKNGGQGVSLGYDYFKSHGIKIGEKILVTVIPMTDTSDAIPMIVTGISQHKGTISYNAETSMYVQGRDHDIDKVSFQMADETWNKHTETGEVNTFDLLHDLLTHNQAHKAWGKKMLIEAKNMIEKPDREFGASDKKMYIPRQIQKEGLKASVTSYTHPLNDQAATLPARQHIAQALWEKFKGQAQKGFVPFDGVDQTTGVQQLVDAMTNVYEHGDLPVLSPLHYKYGNDARAFYGNGAIGKAASGGNKGLTWRQHIAGTEQASTMLTPDMMLKQYFQLSFGKEGAVDIFSNHPYKIDVPDYVSQLFKPEYSKLSEVERRKASKEFYKEISTDYNAHRASARYGEDMATKEAFNTRTEQRGSSTVLTSQEAAIVGLANNPALEGTKQFKNDLQATTAAMMKDSEAFAIPEAGKQRVTEINKEVDALTNWMTNFYTAFDNANQQMDYGKVLKFFAANQLGTDVVHKALFSHFVNSESNQGSLLYALDANKESIYTPENPLPIEITPVYTRKEDHPQYKVRDVQGFGIKAYTTINPDTKQGDRAFAVFTFPRPAVEINAGYKPSMLAKTALTSPSILDTKVEGNELHIPMNRLFNYMEGDQKVAMNPLLKGWLPLFDAALGETTSGKSGNAANVVMESMMVQKNMPVVSTLGMSIDDRNNLFVEALYSYIQSQDKSNGVAGVILAQPFNQGAIANYLINKTKAIHYPTLHNRDWITIICRHKSLFFTD